MIIRKIINRTVTCIAVVSLFAVIGGMFHDEGVFWGWLWTIGLLAISFLTTDLF